MPLSSSWSETHTIVHPTIDSIQGYYALWSIVNGIPCKWYEECMPGEEQQTVPIYLDKPQIMVYPNPSTGTVYIKFTTQVEGVISIYDCSGRLVKCHSERSEESGSGSKEIVLSELKSGVYFYSFSSVPTSRDNRKFNEKGKFIVFRK